MLRRDLQAGAVELNAKTVDLVADLRPGSRSSTEKNNPTPTHLFRNARFLRPGLGWGAHVFEASGAESLRAALEHGWSQNVLVLRDPYNFDFLTLTEPFARSGSWSEDCSPTSATSSLSSAAASPLLAANGFWVLGSTE